MKEKSYVTLLILFVSIFFLMPKTTNALYEEYISWTSSAAGGYCMYTQVKVYNVSSGSYSDTTYKRTECGYFTIGSYYDDKTSAYKGYVEQTDNNYEVVFPSNSSKIYISADSNGDTTCPTIYVYEDSENNMCWVSGSSISGLDDVLGGTLIKYTYDIDSEAIGSSSSGEFVEYWQEKNEQTASTSSTSSTSSSVTVDDCTGLLGYTTDKGSVAYYLVFTFKVIKYVAIILLIALTIMDFIGPLTSQNSDALKKAANKAVKRLILCVVLWLLPSILAIVLDWFNELGISSDCLTGF